MCGIVGYVGDRPCRDLLIAGLEKLEYRGYDSAGVSVISDGGIDSVRAVGNLANLREAVERQSGGRRRPRRGRRAAGDDRARPHALGDPRPGHRGERPPARRLRGRHPHRPQRDHREPRRAAARPEGGGPRVHLGDRRGDRQPPDRAPLRRGSDRGRPKGVRRARAATTRSSRCIASSRTPWSAARKECPLVIGLGENENFVASAIPAFLAETRTALGIKNDEIVTVHKGEVTITDAEGNVQEREPEEVTWDEDAAEKGGYATFMLKEIHEQPDAVAETITDRLPSLEGVDLSDVELDDDFLRGIERIVIVACGTSYHAGLIGRYAIEQWARVPVEMDIASEYRYREPVHRPNDLVIGDHPVRRDRGHPRRDAARARERLQGPGDHQRDGQPGDPRRRRRPLHPIGDRGERRRDQDVRQPGRRDVPARPAARRAPGDAPAGADRRAGRRAQVAAVEAPGGDRREREQRQGDRPGRARTSASSCTSAATSGSPSASRAR